MSSHCSLKSAVTVAGAKNASLTPRFNSRSWRKNTQPASSSPKTSGGASRQPPIFLSVKLPSGSKTGGSRRRNSSVNPRTLICTLLDGMSSLSHTHTHQPSKTKCHTNTSALKIAVYWHAGRVLSYFFDSLKLHQLSRPRQQDPCSQFRENALKTVKMFKSLHNFVL